MNAQYVHYGCGLTAPPQWVNFDVSPRLRLQKIPVVGTMLKARSRTKFPSNIVYGDIIKGLPVADNSCKGVYCSHILEHLSLNDFRTALKNTFRILAPGGIFRVVVPDLESAAKEYVHELEQGSSTGSIHFMDRTLLGIKQRPRGLKGAMVSLLGNSHHLWMWDRHSMASELEAAGFVQIRNCTFGDSEDPMFRYVEEEGRFYGAVAMECRKP